MTCRYCFLSKGVRKNACCYCASVQTVDLNAPHGVWTNIACSECLAVYEAGRDDMARAFWAAVCEEMACDAEDEATRCDERLNTAQGDAWAAYADQLRQWAGEP